MVVFSDMQFDEANTGNWDSMHEKIIMWFHNLGMKLHNRPLLPPKIIYWNLRANTSGHVVDGEQPGTVMLSGYSQSLFKYIFSGDMEDKEIIKNGKKEKRKITPDEMFENILNDEGLDKIRNILYESNEGYLQYYKN